jgi:hypothetical protein
LRDTIWQQRCANERWGGRLLGLGSNCAPHPVTQHARARKPPTPHRNQVLQSLTVKRVSALDVCAGRWLGCPRGIGQQRGTLSHASIPAIFETRPRIVLARRRVLLVSFWKASKPHLPFRKSRSLQPRAKWEQLANIRLVRQRNHERCSNASTSAIMQTPTMGHSANAESGVLT